MLIMQSKLYVAIQKNWTVTKALKSTLYETLKKTNFIFLISRMSALV